MRGSITREMELEGVLQDFLDFYEVEEVSEEFLDKVRRLLSEDYSSDEFLPEDDECPS